jgi:pyrimidine-nucleoside phosphorylase
MDARSVVRTKRDGGRLSEAQMRWFLDAYVRGEVADYQAAALVACIFTRGMEPDELVAWTRAMLESGSRLSFDELSQKKADKHSTGGIGDKVSIPLAPAVAACGVAVPMISGRGLGHTGGTLDKLESIPGFRVRLSEDELHRAIGRTGVAFGAQTESLVPADRKLYQLRDATGLVESIPLIASSILSKKLAEGLDALVLDVKFGSGAFLPEPERGAELARVMLSIARSMGVAATAFHTAMDRPVGAAVGHALEIEESLACLAGGGPADLRELVLLQGGEMLRLAGAASSLDDGRRRIAEALDSGRARRVFELVVREQGGDPRVVADPALLPRAPAVDPWHADRAGFLAFRDLREVGWAVADLGGGRTRIEDAIDPAVGLVWKKRAGERVETGDLLCEIHHARGRGLDACRARLAAAVAIGARAEPAPLVRATWHG